MAVMSDLGAHWEETVSILEDSLAEASNAEERLELHDRIARIYDEKLDRPDEAAPHYQAVFDADPSDDEVGDALERIYEGQTGDEAAQALASVLIDRSEVANRTDVFVSRLRRASEIFANDLDNVEGAFLVLLTALTEETIGTPDLLDDLTELAERSNQRRDLAEKMEAIADATHDDELAFDLHRRLATWHADEFHQPDEAERHLEAALRISPGDPELLGRLAEVHEETGASDKLADVLRRRAGALEETSAKVGDLMRLAKLLERRDPVSDEVVETYESILELDPKHSATLDTLADIYESRGDSKRLIQILEKRAESTSDSSLLTDIRSKIAHEWDLLGDVNRAIDTFRDSSVGHQTLIHDLKEAAKHARDDAQRARYFYEVGQIYREIGNEISAYSYFETALKHDPNLVEAAVPLIDNYLKEDRWERALPLLEQLLQERSHDLEPRERLRRTVQFARACDKAGNHDLAFRAYRDAHEIDSHDIGALRGLSDHLYQRERFGEAFKLLMELQYEHSERLGRQELGELFHRAGHIKERAGKNRKAIELYQKALEHDSRRDTRLALVDLLEEEEMWQPLIEQTEILLRQEKDPSVRFKYLVRLGDTWGRRLNRPDRAMPRYQQALEIEPDSVVILRKLLELFQRAGKWHQAVGVLQELTERAESPEKKSKMYYTMGVICRDELGHDVKAVEHFDSALDCDVRFLKAFEAIDRILTQAKAWKELERAYRRMLRRVSERDDGSYDDLYFMLWTNLGEIYRSRLGHPESAVEAYKTASELRPDDPRVREILVQLYERTGASPKSVIEEHRRLLQQDPFRVESYRALWNTYMRRREFDRAWCAAAVLSYLREETQQEGHMYRQYVGRNLRLLKGQFTPELLGMLHHDKLDRQVTVMMSYLAVGLRSHFARTLKDWGVHKRKDRIDKDDSSVLTRMFDYVTETVGLMPKPRLYLMENQPVGFRNMNVEPPAYVLGGDLAEGQSDRQLAFHFGKVLTMGRPETNLASLGFPAEVLSGFVLAAMQCTDPSQNFIDAMGQEGRRLVKEIQSMPAPQQLEVMKVAKVYASQQKLPDMQRWLRAVELSTDRAALLFCNELDIAAWKIRNDTAPISNMSGQDRVRELLLFMVSPQHFELRRRFGVAIG